MCDACPRLEAIEVDLQELKSWKERQDAALRELRSEYGRHGVELANLRIAVDRHSDILTTLDGRVLTVQRQQARTLEEVGHLKGLVEQALELLRGGRGRE
jgi:hypothetical protein